MAKQSHRFMFGFCAFFPLVLTDNYSGTVVALGEGDRRRLSQISQGQAPALGLGDPTEGIWLGEEEMNKRGILSFSVLAAALIALALPVVAVAQGRYPDYRRDRDYGRNGRYDDRYVRDSIHRLDRLAKDFQRDLDRALDRSRRDGTRYEDQLNSDASEFRNAVGNLKSRFGNGRDLDRSANEAQRVLALGNRIDRSQRLFYNDRRTANEWSQIRRELQVLEDAYGYSGYYGNDDDYRRQQRNRDIDDWMRRIPWPR
jgi:hypothetical protein